MIKPIITFIILVHCGLKHRKI